MWFFHIVQCVVYVQPRKLLVTNTSEAMVIGRNLSSEKSHQLQPQIISITVKDIWEESSVAARVLYKKCKKIYRQAGYFKDIKAW